MVASAATAASLTTSVVSSARSTEISNSDIDLHCSYRPSKLRAMAVIRPLIIGFATTFKHLFRKPITVNYPDQKVPMFPKWRGKQVLMRDENGLEKWVAGGLRAVACPADAS